MGALLDVATKVRQLTVARAQRAAAVNFIIKVVGIPLGAAVAGVCQFVDFDPKTGASVAQMLGITGTLVIGLLSLIVGLFEKDAGEELAEAGKAIDIARDLQSEADLQVQIFEAYEDELNVTSRAWLTQTLARAIVEQLVSNQTGTAVEWLNDLLEATWREMIVALQFANGDQWTLSIYQAIEKSPDRFVLRNIATQRANPCNIVNAREWPEGTGVVGAAYANQCELVLPKVTDPGVKDLFATKMATVRPDDAALYKSMAASPIHLLGKQRPWGVVVATNDQETHFNALSTEAVRPDMIVKEMAAVAGLVVAAHDAIAAAHGGTMPPRSSGPTSPSGTP